MKYFVAIALLSASFVDAPPATPLEITNIRDDLSPRHRLLFAHPGFEYNVRAAVIGGSFPYRFSLENAPNGMQIDSTRGEIKWPNPIQDAQPTLTVMDAEGTRRSVTWMIRVTKAPFRFVDSEKGRPAQANGCTSGCGDGSLERPWKTLSDLYHRGEPGTFVYFRAGLYRMNDIPRGSRGTPWERVEFSGRRHPVVWLAYPGERPMIDFGHKPQVNVAPLLRFSGPDVYVDGFDVENAHLIAFQFLTAPGAGPTFRRLRMRGLGPGIDGSNAAFIMTTTSTTPSDYMVIQDCEFYGVTGEAVTIKIYAQRKLLIEDTVHSHATVGIELKSDVREFTVRSNSLSDIKRTALGGNMHITTTTGAFLFNYANAPVALDINQDGMAGPIEVFRNTFIGRVQVRNTDHEDGPFRFSHNVIVSDDVGRPRGSRVHHQDVAAADRVMLDDNLTGSPRDGLVDSHGHLNEKFKKHVGAFGHQIANRVR